MRTRTHFIPDWPVSPKPRPRRRIWLLLLPVIASLIGLSAAPSHAATRNWWVKSVNTVGCNSDDWNLTLHFEGFDAGTYVGHTQVISDGKVYMNEAITFSPAWTGDDWDDPWRLEASGSYGPVDNPGTWPITPGKPMKAVFTMEQPKGTVLTSWTLVAPSCDSPTLLYNGPTAADPDEDYLAAPADLCPSLHALSVNGCPTVDRTLAVKAKRDPRRVLGKLVAGNPTLYAGQPVTIWRSRPGPDRIVAVRTTNSAGAFKARVRKGRYYATAPSLLVPTVGQAAPERSTTARVR
jgi:hypothetical protein